MGRSRLLIGSISSVMPLSLREIRGAHQVRNERPLRGGPLVHRHKTGEAVDRPAANRHDVIQRLHEERVEFPLTIRHRRQPGPPSRRARC